ncbi:MAG TPA: hypothetical protein VLY46_00060 [Usitatibacter sp.]|nr:hypothetical protein [Usitatibacter sp.]
MRELRPLLLFATLCAAGAALAQATPAASGAAASQRGFFAPQPGDDPSLFHTLPPETYAQPSSTPQQAQSGAQPAATPPLVVVVPEANPIGREPLDRAALEAEQARARMSRAPAPINGAFTGNTDENHR